MSRPPPYPPSPPDASITLWHGMTIGTRFAWSAPPTALAAIGLPAFAASHLYERTLPYGIFISSDQTRLWN